MPVEYSVSAQDEAPGRLPYAEPVLVEYGSLADLTLTGKGTKTDHGSDFFLHSGSGA